MFNPLFATARRRTLAVWLCAIGCALALPTAFAQGAAKPAELQLYGVRLKDASAEAFVAAARAAGARPIDERAPGWRFDTREAGVPGLLRLHVIADSAGGVVTAQFLIKAYGQENEALRQLLVQKYGLPTVADGARRPFPSFAGRFAPRGTFDWDFAGGMKLIYRQPAIGDATLSYTDVEKAQRLSNATAPVLPVNPAGGDTGTGSGAPKGDLGSRF